MKVAVVIPFKDRSIGHVLHRVVVAVKPQVREGGAIIIATFGDVPDNLLYLCKKHGLHLVSGAGETWNVCAARNAGAMYARDIGMSVVQFLDADVILLHGHLDEACKRLLGKRCHVMPRVVRRNGNHSGLGIGCPMVRIEDWLAVRGYDESWVDRGEDIEFDRRLNLHGSRSNFIHDPEAIHIDHEERWGKDSKDRFKRRFVLQDPDEQAINEGKWGIYTKVYVP